MEQFHSMMLSNLYMGVNFRSLYSVKFKLDVIS
jgi:hypothetical protein